MFDKINVRYLKLAGLALGVIGAGIASMTQSKEIERAVDKSIQSKTLELINSTIDAEVSKTIWQKADKEIKEATALAVMEALESRSGN